MSQAVAPRNLAPVIKETPIHHASGELRWLDATSAGDLSPAAMSPVDRALRISLTSHPADLRWIHKRGRTAFWRRPVSDIVRGASSETQRARPVLPSFRLAGTVSDPTGAYNPRPFDLQLGAGGSLGVALYPTPQATRFGTGGGLTGMVRFDGAQDPALAGRPAAWAVVEVAVTVAQQDVRRFRAQCDGKGDFRLSLWRLPPLPQGTTSYPAEITVSALATATAGEPIDPGDLPAVLVAPVSAGAPAPSIPIDIVPGETLRVESAGGRTLAIRPAPPPV